MILQAFSILNENYIFSYILIIHEPLISNTLLKHLQTHTLFIADYSDTNIALSFHWVYNADYDTFRC